MALRTLGTNTTTTLSGLIWQPAGLLRTDLGALNALINQSTPGTPGTVLGAGRKTFFDGGSGVLTIPGRNASVALRPGDFVGVDSLGWPIVVSYETLAYGSTSWTHT